MKIISIWQPWASLVVQGHKFFETRSWAAPRSLIGQRIGIAATKSIKPEQIAAYNDEEFQQFYSETGLPELSDLPRGAILGTALLHSCELMTEEFMDDVTDEEKAFGVWSSGRYAWRLREPVCFETPVIAKGAQGVWTFDPHNVILQNVKARLRPDQERTENIRRRIQERTLLNG